MILRKPILPALITIILASCSSGYTLTNQPVDYRTKMVQLDKLSIGLHVADTYKSPSGGVSATLMVNRAQNKAGIKISNLAVTVENTESGDKYTIKDTIYMRYSADTVIKRNEQILSNRDLLNGKTIRIADRSSYIFSYHFAAPPKKRPSKNIQAQVEFNQTDTLGNKVKVIKTFSFQRKKYLNVSGN